MKHPQGRVVSIGGGDDAGLTIVEVDTTIACQRCAAGKGCGAGLLGGRVQNRRVEAVLGNGINVNAGDAVSIALQPQNLLRAAIIVYGYPLAGAVLAALIAFGLVLGDSFAAVFALAGLGAGLILARLRLRSAQCLRHFRPLVVENLSSMPG